MIGFLLLMLAGPLDEGRILLAKGDAARAAPLLEKAVAQEPKRAEAHYWLARAYMAEAAKSVNAMRLVSLAWNIGEELDLAVRLDPNLMDARLDLLRYYVMTPRVLGGSMDKARLQSAEIAKRDTGLGEWADGYIFYRNKEYGAARLKLEAAVKEPSSKELALLWLGYLSQESQQYDKAFECFEQMTSATGLYEIGRTSVFAHRDFDRGEAALRKYLASVHAPDMPSPASAHLQLGLIAEQRGDREGAKREIELALKLDPEVEGGRVALKRVNHR